MSETLDAPQVDAAPEPQADPSDDLRAAIGAAYDEVAGAEAPADPEATEGPPRDERGRFAGAADPSAAPEPEPEPEAPAVEVAAPAIPPDLAPVQAVLDEYKHQYAARGLAPAEAMRALFGAEQALRQRPYEAIAQLARDFGVDLGRFAQQAPPQPAQQAPQAQPHDPAVNAALERLTRLEGYLSTQQQQTEHANRAQTERTIADFAADPKHTHFPAVRSLMGGLMQAGAANDLGTAYEMACRAHPEISKTIAKSEADARDRAAAEDRRKAAAEAKAKAVSVRGSSVVNGFTKPPESLRDTLLAAWDGRLPN